MADEIQKLYDLPDVSFIDDITFDQILNENITNWQNEYEQEKNLLDSVLNIIKEKGICNGTKR